MWQNLYNEAVEDLRERTKQLEEARNQIDIYTGDIYRLRGERDEAQAKAAAMLEGLEYLRDHKGVGKHEHLYAGLVAQKAGAGGRAFLDRLRKAEERIEQYTELDDAFSLESRNHLMALQRAGDAEDRVKELEAEREEDVRIDNASRARTMQLICKLEAKIARQNELIDHLGG